MKLKKLTAGHYYIDCDNGDTWNFCKVEKNLQIFRIDRGMTRKSARTLKELKDKVLIKGDF